MGEGPVLSRPRRHVGDRLARIFLTTRSTAYVRNKDILISLYLGRDSGNVVALYREVLELE